MRVRKVTRTRLIVAIMLWILGMMIVAKPPQNLVDELREEAPIAHYIHVAVEEPPASRGGVRMSVERIETSEISIYTSQELELLYSIVWAESGNDYMNMVATANVVLNRVNSQYFPDTIKEVVYQGNGRQFNGIWRSNFGFYTDTTVQAVHQAIENPIFDKDVVYFTNIDLAADSDFVSSIIIPNKVEEFGGHTFARDKRGW